MPVAGLLFDPALRPDAAAIDRVATASGDFAVIGCEPLRGEADLLCDGLGFALRALAPAPALALDRIALAPGLPAGFAPEQHALVTLAPAVDLAGAGRLLPVVRVLSGLILALRATPGLAAVVWLPAQLAMTPDWFASAVEPWLAGGPFPALALTGLVRAGEGIESRGLGYFTGQEFALAPRADRLEEADMRAAVRLVDWMVAHGRVDAPCEAVLTGFGTVQLDPGPCDRVQARRV